MIFRNEPLSNHTTLRIGGPADYLYRARNIRGMIRSARNARKNNLPVTILGWGSNVLIGDLGIRGLVIKNETREIKILEDKKPVFSKIRDVNIYPRFHASHEGTFKYDFSDLDYSEEGCSRVLVRVDSGVSLQMLMNEMMTKGITGLQWYARIPGTVGGAVFNNIHGGTHFFSEIIHKVKVLDKDGKIRIISGKDLGLDYDKSRFHISGEVIIQVEMLLYRGDVDKAKAVMYEWAKRKSLQPPRSAGCTFKNISIEDKEKLGYPTTSAGYIIEHVLKLSGYKIGKAKISPAHNNFIVNEGGATAKDYLALVELIKSKAREKLGIELVPEIILLGDFD